MKLITTVIFSFISTLIFSQNFEIYVSDAGNFNNPPWQILKFDSSGQNPSVFINTQLAWPQDILFLEDAGTVLISNLNTGRITRYNGNTGAYIDNFAAGIGGPTRMKIGPDGLLYVLQWSGNGKVKRYQLDGSFVDDFTSVGVPQSIGLDWDKDNNLYVSSYNGRFVRKFNTLGVDLGLFINANLLGPTNIWFDDNGDLLISDYNGTAVKRFDANGNYINDFLTGLSNSEGVAFMPNGNILIGNGGNSSVKMYDSTGTYISDYIASGAGNLLTPNAIVIRPITITSTKEPLELETNIFYPTVGRTFSIAEKYIDQIEKIEVYDISGNLHQIIRHMKAPIWEADNYASGIYIMTTTFKNGAIHAERIVVE